MEDIFFLLCEMAPWLLLGFFIAGLMHVYVPVNLYTKYLGKRNFSSVINAAMLGVPLPLCSCGVLPTALSLHKEGASRGATVSFLIATPQTGIDSILATYSLMGLPFAITRPIAAFITSLFGGLLANKTGKASDTLNKSASAESACCHKNKTSEGNCCSSKKANKESSCQCHAEKAESACHCDNKKKSSTTKLKDVFKYAFIDMMDEMGRWLIIGIIIAGLITAFVPDDFLVKFSDRPLLGMLLALTISLPMYLCATGSIPIAVALMLKGLSPGAALVLLMAGPACNIASILVIRGSLGWNTLCAYLSSIIIGAIGMGLVVDYCLPREWFTSALMSAESCHTEISWWSIAAAAILIILLIFSLIKKLGKNKTASGCHCNH